MSDGKTEPVKMTTTLRIGVFPLSFVKRLTSETEESDKTRADCTSARSKSKPIGQLGPMTSRVFLKISWQQLL